jgi:hypothetical protein
MLFIRGVLLPPLLTLGAPVYGMGQARIFYVRGINTSLFHTILCHIKKQ